MKNNNILLYAILLKSLFIYSQGYSEDDNVILNIPVVFHILTPEDVSESTQKSYEYSINNMVSSINKRINEVNISRINDVFNDIVSKPNIKLFIPKKNKNNNLIKGVTWHKFSNYHLGSNIPILDDVFLRFYGYENSKEFLNIWIVDIFDLQWDFKFCNQRIKDNFDLAGYNPKWKIIDGIVLDIDNFFDMLKDPFIVIHELGHYLGLKHIWGKTVVGSEGNCNDDDGINDTPQQKKEHNNSNTPDKSCDGISDSNHQNFMDYSYDVGMFTNEQAEIMRNNIIIKRSGLLWKNNFNNSSELITGFKKDTRDNQSYKWVQIGNQKWMSENLNYKTANSKCYGDNEINCDKYGRLYDWEDANTVCPTGWRLPSKADWKQLTTTVNNNQNSIRSEQGWLNNKNGNNSSGLNILPSGYKFYYTNFSGLGKFAKIWLSNSSGSSAYSRDIGQRGYDRLPQAGIDFKRDYLSCRCIEDKSSISNIDSQMPTIDNNTQESSSTINEDFFIGEWQGVGRIYALRKDKKYVIKFNSSSRSPLPPKPYAIWSYDGKFLKFKQRNRSPFVYTVKIISQTKIGLYNHDGSFFNYLNRKEIKPNSPTSSPNENIKKLNGRDYNRQSTQPKKKGVTLRDLIKKRN